VLLAAQIWFRCAGFRCTLTLALGCEWCSANSAQRIHLSDMRLQTSLFSRSRERFAMYSHSAACRINTSEVTISRSPFDALRHALRIANAERIPKCLVSDSARNPQVQLKTITRQLPEGAGRRFLRMPRVPAQRRRGPLLFGRLPPLIGPLPLLRSIRMVDRVGS
jgi:hypothetical protein